MTIPTPPDGARLDFAGEMSYGDYLRLEELLAAQQPRSADHNEMLFIVQHQATELWMKLVIHELRAARGHIRADNLQPAFKMLARVARIMAQLNQSWDVLSTLTPAEYSAFRASLGSSSGFQSFQYRMIEFLLGNKSAVMMEPHRHREGTFTALESLLAEPSIYDEAIRVLARRGLPVDRACVERDCRAPHALRREMPLPIGLRDDVRRGGGPAREEREERGRESVHAGSMDGDCGEILAPPESIRAAAA